MNKLSNYFLVLKANLDIIISQIGMCLSAALAINFRPQWGQSVLEFIVALVIQSTKPINGEK